LLKDFSFVGFIHKRTEEYGQDIKVTSDWFEFGGGANYHFYNPVSSINKPICYLTLNLGRGNAKIKTTVISNNVSTDNTVSGTDMFYTAGIGAKYILGYGLGARALLDYYNTSESYSYPNSVTVKRSLSGPRIQFGLSYRF
jgi:hypothetical protein